MRWTTTPVFLLSILIPSVASANLDLAFVLDTTGSMSAEIREAKERVKQIADALKTSAPNQRLRVGVVAFRDRGDAYVTKVSPLSADIDTSFAFLSSLTADGGGDGPEDVLSGIKAALEELDWDSSAQTERQIFLIGDAQPHLDYQNGPKPESLFERARTNRIIINSIGCRSLSPDGIEFFRTAAYRTEGRYQHIGRVDARTPKLAEAMLDTLTTPAMDSETGPALAVTMRDRRAAPERDRFGVRYRWVPPEKRNQCHLKLVTPAGVGLARPAEVRRGKHALIVHLALVEAASGSESRELIVDDCRHGAEPIHIAIAD